MKKKNKKIVFSKIVLILLLLLVSIKTIHHYYIKNQQNKVVFQPNILKDGDLILRSGQSPESYAVYLADNNSEFSHIGIIKVENNIPFVIHAVPHKLKTIKKETLEEFLKPKNASGYAIYRAPLNQLQLNKIANEANTFYTKKLTFDNDFDLNTNNKLYCTELVLKAYKNSGIDLKIQPKTFNYILGKHAIVYPSQFINESIFSKITIK